MITLYELLLKSGSEIVGHDGYHKTIAQADFRRKETYYQTRPALRVYDLTRSLLPFVQLAWLCGYDTRSKNVFGHKNRLESCRWQNFLLPTLW